MENILIGRLNILHFYEYRELELIRVKIMSLDDTTHCFLKERSMEIAIVKDSYMHCERTNGDNYH
jgi:hypothetical protein